MAAGSRYVLEFVLAGAGKTEKEISGITSSLGKVTAVAGLVTLAFAQVGNMVANMANAGMQATAQMGESLTALSDRAKSGAMVLAGYSRGIAESIVKDAATFQDAESALMFAFGSNWKNIYNEVLKDSANLAFTFKETVDLAANVGRMGVNPFGGNKAEDQEFIGRTGEKVRALEIFQDTASALQLDMMRLTKGVHQAVAGTFREIQRGWAMPHHQVERIKKEVKAAGTEQEKYNALVKILGELYGGATSMRKLNWNFLVLQLDDLIEQFRAKVGSAAVKVMSLSLRGFIDELTALVRSDMIMAGLTDAFKPFGFVMKLGIDAMSSFVRTFKTVAEKVPWLFTLAGGLTLVVTAGLAVASVFLAIAGGVIAAVSAGLMFTSVFIAALPFIGIMLPLIGIATTGFVGLVSLIGVLGFTAQSHFRPMFHLFEKGTLLLRGFYAMITTFMEIGETGMDPVLLEQLGDAGLMGIVKALSQAIYGFDLGWKEFKATILEYADVLWPRTLRLLGDLGTKLGLGSGGLKTLQGMLNGTISPLDALRDFGGKAARVILVLADHGIRVAEMAKNFFTAADNAKLFTTAIDLAGEAAKLLMTALAGSWFIMRKMIDAAALIPGVDISDKTLESMPSADAGFETLKKMETAFAETKRAWDASKSVAGGGGSSLFDDLSGALQNEDSPTFKKKNMFGTVPELAGVSGRDEQGAPAFIRAFQEAFNTAPNPEAQQRLLKNYGMSSVKDLGEIARGTRALPNPQDSRGERDFNAIQAVDKRMTDFGFSTLSGDSQELRNAMLLKIGDQPMSDHQQKLLKANEATVKLLEDMWRSMRDNVPYSKPPSSMSVPGLMYIPGQGWQVGWGTP